MIEAPGGLDMSIRGTERFEVSFGRGCLEAVGLKEGTMKKEEDSARYM